MSFSDLFNTYQWDDIQKSIYSKRAKDVEQALHKNKCDLEDFKALISPAALSYLEPMAQLSHNISKSRFGKVMQLFIPMYLSNECSNTCTYCGFSITNKIHRKTLTPKEIEKEVRFIKNMGFEHILLVTGESIINVGMDYFKEALKQVVPSFSNVSMEVQPLRTHEYTELIELGLHGVYVYQETYLRDRYKKYHPRGKKSDFDYRLETPERLGLAGIHKTGLGVLLGLENWRTDSFFTALHLKYLEKKYWKTRYSISFPRLRPFSGGFQPNVEITDRELVQLICAYRIFNPDVELSLSTRESKLFRNHVMKLGITSMSAGSKTNPGGYAVEKQSLEQFEIDDSRTPLQIAEMIKNNGYETVWKDWDPVFNA